MEKIIEFQPAFDRRHSDPKKNYGVGDVRIRFILKGERGAVQFLMSTGMMLPHVEKEFHEKRFETGYNFFKPSGWDIGYHSPTPKYEGQPSMKCGLFESGVCYYDGSSLQAEEFLPSFLAEGEDAVWRMLQNRYEAIFGDD